MEAGVAGLSTSGGASPGKTKGKSKGDGRGSKSKITMSGYDIEEQEERLQSFLNNNASGKSKKKDSRSSVKKDVNSFIDGEMESISDNQPAESASLKCDVCGYVITYTVISIF